MVECSSPVPVPEPKPAGTETYGVSCTVGGHRAVPIHIHLANNAYIDINLEPVSHRYKLMK